MLSCFPFPDIFVKSANRDANISHSDLHSKQLDLCSYCVITKMNHCHVSSKAWQDGDFSAGKCQLNPAPYCSHDTNCILCVYHRKEKHPAEKGSALNFTLCQEKHGNKWSSESSSLINSKDNKNNKKKFINLFLKNRIKMLDKKHMQTHTLHKSEEQKWPCYSIIVHYFCIWEKISQICPAVTRLRRKTVLLGMG